MKLRSNSFSDTRFPTMKLIRMAFTCTRC